MRDWKHNVAMTNDEKLRIIRNWSYDLTIHTGGVYYRGYLLHKRFGNSKNIGPYLDRSAVVLDAYNLAKDAVWDMVVRCG